MCTMEKARMARSRRSARFLFTLAAAAAAVTLYGPVAARGECEPRWLPGEGIPGVNGDVRTVTTWDPDGGGPAAELLVVGGSFSVAGDVPANNIAAWDGSRWQTLGTGTGYFGVRALTVYNGELIAGGEFTTAGGVACSRIARWNGSQWQPLGTGMSGPSNPFVRTLTVYNGALIAGGSFTTAGGQVSAYWARWGHSRRLRCLLPARRNL